MTKKVINTLCRKPQDKMSFTQFIQWECGAAYDLTSILDNLMNDDVSESLINYANAKKRKVSFTKSEIKLLAQFINRKALS